MGKADRARIFPAVFFRRKPSAPAALPDAELLARYRRLGEVADLGTLYERHLPAVFATCRRYLRPDEDAQDATMQIFEHLVEKLKTHEVDNFPAWLHATARNHCLMQLRARQRAGPGARHLTFPDAAAMENELARHLPDETEATAEAETTETALQALEHALTQLPAAQRQCLELFFLARKSYQEIAAETGLPLNQVKSHLQNGKRMLRQQLAVNN